MTEPHEPYRQYLETLSPQTLGQLAEHVTNDVHFKDPFNDVRGVAAMTAVFDHMFSAVKGVKFRVSHAMTQGDTCLMSWRFEGELATGPWTFEGTSVIRFSADGRVVEHVDHWDAARNFYERLPVIGHLLARIRRRLAVS